MTADGKELTMQLVKHWKVIAGTALIALIGAPCVHASAGTGDKLTIGGVIYTDTQDPIRSGLAGVAVTIQGDKGTFTVTTDGILGLWKVDVPQGTYTVTPRMKDYAMQHLFRGWCDGQASIPLDVKPANLAAIQSIQFLAIYWPDPTPEQPAIAPSAGPSRTGGGCATTGEHPGRACDGLVPYVACVGLLAVRSRVDARKRTSQDSKKL
jgi:hypothetical protein